jgi:hypothetical protein
MLDSTVELLAGLCLIALPLMISFCFVGSIVAALRATNESQMGSTINPNYRYDASVNTRVSNGPSKHPRYLT